MSLSTQLCCSCAHKPDPSQEHCGKFKRIPEGLCRLYEKDLEVHTETHLDPKKVLALAGVFGWGQSVGVTNFTNSQIVAFAEAAIKNQESLKSNESNGSRIIPINTAR